jgi:hypothetical protein
MRPDKIKFTKVEREFLDNPNWYESFRVLAANPGAASADFRARLEAERARHKEGTEEHLTYDRYLKVIDDVLANGLDAAMVHLLGHSGVLAGRARRKREEYYETTRASHLLEAIDLFILAVAIDDDPLEFNGAMTVQGLAATLFDLGQRVDDRGIDLLVGHAFLTATIGRLAARPLVFYPVWADALEKASRSAATAFSEARTLFDPESADGRFLDDVRLDLGALAEQCRALNPDLGRFGDLTYRLVAAALVLADRDLVQPAPQRDPEAEEFLAQVQTAVGDLLADWMRRYAVDAHRVFLAMTLAHLDAAEEPNPPDDAEGTYFEASVDIQRAATRLIERLDSVPPMSDETDRLFGTVIDLLRVATLTCTAQPNVARPLLDRAAALIVQLPGREDDIADLAHREASLHEYLGCRATFEILLRLLEAGIAAAAEDRDIGRATAEFRAVLGETDVPAFLHSFIEALVAFHQSIAGEADTIEWDTLGDLDSHETWAAFDDETRRIVAMTMTSVSLLMVVEFPLAAWCVLVHDLGLTDPLGDTLALRDLTHVALVGDSNLSVVVARDADVRETLAPHIAALLDLHDLSTAASVAVEEAYLAVVAARRAGQLTYARQDTEITLLNALAIVAQRTDRHQDALEWLNEARRLTRGSRYVANVAIISTNLASLALDQVDATGSWELDVEEGARRLWWLSVGLAGVAQAFHALLRLDQGLRPTDRYLTREVGFESLRVLGLRLLRAFSSPPLNAEFILNLTNNWFYREHLAVGGPGVEKRRLMSVRGRSWLADALVPDLPAEGDDEAVASDDLVKILAADPNQPRLWLGGAVNHSTDEVMFSLVGPTLIDGSYLTGVSTIADVDLDTASARLGAALPDDLWNFAAYVRTEAPDVRPILYVSVDSGLPPISIGMWSCPSDDAILVADVFDVLYCPTMSVVRPAVPLTEAVYVVCDPLGDLSGARIVPPGTTQVCGNGSDGFRPATRAQVVALMNACAQSAGVFLYQGHSSPGVQNSPGSAALYLEPAAADAVLVSAPLTMLDLLADLDGASLPPRLALISCGSGASPTRSDGTSIAVAAVAGGASAVVSTLAPVQEHDSWGDVVASVVDLLRSADPVRAFSRWQASVARGPDGIRKDVATLALFGSRLEDDA